MADIREIGVVHSDFGESADPFEMRKQESRITVFEPFAEGLYGIEENSHILVLFHFDRSVDYTLKGPRYHGEVKGVFASRSPRRPGNIGCTVVELLEREGTELRVRGLDALDGTPVLDIKPYTPGLDEGRIRKVEEERLIRKPRADVLPMLKNDDAERLFLEAGRFHGEYCAELALGVLAALGGIRKLADAAGTGMAELLGTGMPEKIRAVSFLGGCFVDGLQVVSGCTAGNGLLRAEGGDSSNAGENPSTGGFVAGDCGKSAVLFSERGGRAVRVIFKQSFGEASNLDPFELIREEWDELFRIESGTTASEPFCNRNPEPSPPIGKRHREPF